MITFLDENDVEYGALATIKATNAVNGERSLTGTIVSGDYVLSNIERGWRLRFDDEYYVVTYAKPVDEGRDVQVEFDAVHQFFWDFDKSSVYDQLTDGSHTFRAYLDFIFKNSGYSYTVDSALNVYAFEKQSFGFKKRLTLFNDIITSTGVEFQVNGKVVRILEKVGTDLSTVVRKNFNMNELTIEKNIGDFVTYQKGFGAYFDEEDHSKGRLEVEYTSPLASVYGKLEAEPFVDERYSQNNSLLAVLKENVDNSYAISVSLDMEDLTRAGYKYKQPVAGDYIMAINETLDFQEKIRIVSFTSEYDVQGILVKHEVTCNDIGSVKKLSASYTHTQHQAANAEVNANIAYEFANKALVSADGKNTNYYGDTFPVDNPKGTLKKGDLLFLTVGDTVKQYYWNGADWIINPVLDDVEAFKEQIAEELKDVPDREELENKISEELATSKAEIETQIETAKTQAESNAKEYADTINDETAKVAELANAAAGEIKADLVNVKNNLTSTSLVANNAQAAVDAAKQELTEVANELSTAKQDLANSVDAVNTKVDSAKEELTQAKQDLANVASELNTAKQDLANSVTAVNTKVDNAKAELTQAKQQLTTVSDDLSKAKTDFQNAVSAVDTKATNLKSDLTQAKQDLANQAQQIQEQASAQSELTNRISSVEKTANGTKTTVGELSKTVAQNGKDITSVTNRTKTVEDDLAGTKTTLSQVQTTADSTSQKTATLETGLNGLNAKFDNLSVGGVNLIKQSTAQKGVRLGISEVLINDDKHMLTDWIKIEPSTVYTLSTYEDVNEANMYYSLAWYSTNNADYSGWISRPTGAALAADLKGGRQYASPANAVYAKVSYPIKYSKVKLERGNISTDYSQNGVDLEQKVAEYKQNADQNYASLQTTVQNLDGTVQHNKTVADQTAAGFKTRIESLETYKNGESERANAYFQSAKTETAKQLTAERTAIANNYVAKSTYTSDVTGIRNDLSATTTTANTIKTNLANYQASNDRAVANLQSNLQTANGNISSLKTKVEAVPGQITSAVSAVEGKIPTSAGGRNLALGTSADWSSGMTRFSGINNETVVMYKIYNKGLKVGDRINARIVIKYSDIVAVEGQTARILSQTEGNVTHWGSGGLDVGKPIFPSGEDDEVVLTGATTITENHLRNEYWIWRLRVDYVKRGKIQWKEAKVEVGDLPTPWSPAPEDTAEQISNLSSEIKQTADGMTLLATKTELSTAKNELQSGIATATNKANAAQNTANNNAQTISTHTTQISALNTGLSAKVSQTDFNTLSGRVTTAENNITAKANELSSKITSVENKIPTNIGTVNLIKQSTAQKGVRLGISEVLINDDKHMLTDWIKIEPSTVYTLTTYEDVNEAAMYYSLAWYSTNNADYSGWIDRPTGAASAANLKGGKQYKSPANATYAKVSYPIKYSKVKLERGNIATDYNSNPEDYDDAITQVKSEIKQTADGMTLLATKTEVNNAKTDLQSGINAATNKANNAQSAANNNAQTISTHTAQISALNTGLSAKVSQSDFNTLSGRVTTAENNITAKANELSSKITSVEGKIPTSVGGRNLLVKTNQGKTNWDWSISSGGTTAEDYNVDGVKAVKMTRTTSASASWHYIQYQGLIRKLIEPDTKYTLSFDVKPSVDVTFTATLMRGDGAVRLTNSVTMNQALANQWTKVSCVLTSKETLPDESGQVVYLQGMPITNGNWLIIKNIKLEKGAVLSDWSPAPEDTIEQISSLSSELKQTADGITLLATKTEVNTAKTELQSGITTATNKANNNAQTISTHTTQISALNTGLQAKVSQTDFNTLSGRVTTAENNITAKANELSSKITSVEGKIPTSVGGTNLVLYSADPWQAPQTGYYQFFDTAKTSETYNGAVVYKTRGAWNRLGINLGKHLVERRLLKVGDVLTYSVLAKTDQKTPIQSRLFVRYDNQSGAENINGKEEIINLTNEWKKISVTFTVTEKMLSKEHRVNYLGWEQTTNSESGKFVYYTCNKIERGNIATDYNPAPEDTAEQISSLSSELKQTKDGITLLATKTELNTAKNELQSGINTATNKANAAQNTANSAQNKANSNAQTISTHTTQISALNTGLSAKVSQSDFNTLSGRVTTAENNITAKANELSSKISSVEGKIPTSVGAVNLLHNSKGPFQPKGSRIDNWAAYPDTWINMEKGKKYTLSAKGTAPFSNVHTPNSEKNEICLWLVKHDENINVDRVISSSTTGTAGTTFTWNDPSGKYQLRVNTYKADNSNYAKEVQIEEGNLRSTYSQNESDIESKVAEFKQTTDSIKASVTSLDKSTVKSSSLTINADGIVMKAGKSTTDVANAIGSYFAVNQNAINLFSDKINVKGNMIVSGAITSDKIASKQINTAHLNGKIITADVISSNAVTADAIKAGAVTTDKMSANSINGDRITAGTLDAAKIKAGSITASQIASGTITSNQIKVGGISSANIAAGAITGDKIAAGAIDANKIAANAITANMITGGKLNSTNGATSFDLNAGTLTFNNNYGYIQRSASDKVFEITTYLGTSSGSQEYLTSAFNIRKSDNSRQSGVKFTLYNTVENKPTAEAKINADALILYDSQSTRLFSVHGKSTFAGGINFQGWGDIPIAKVHGGLVVNDIGIGSHTKSLLKIVEELCKKAGILWV